MYAWDSETVHSGYEQWTLGFLTKFDRRTALHRSRVATAFREFVKEGCD